MTPFVHLLSAASTVFVLSWSGPDICVSNPCDCTESDTNTCICFSVPPTEYPCKHSAEFETVEAAVARANALVQDCNWDRRDPDGIAWTMMLGDERPEGDGWERHCQQTGREGFSVVRRTEEAVELERIEDAEEVQRTDRIIKSVRFEVKP